MFISAELRQIVSFETARNFFSLAKCFAYGCRREVGTYGLCPASCTMQSIPQILAPFPSNSCLRVLRTEYCGSFPLLTRLRLLSGSASTLFDTIDLIRTINDVNSTDTLAHKQGGEWKVISPYLKTHWTAILFCARCARAQSIVRPNRTRL